MSEGKSNGISRRNFLKLGVAAGGLVVAGPEWIGTALANRHPHPRPTSITYLDRNMYRKNTDVLTHFGPGEQRGGKMQMMAMGTRRFLFQQGDVIEVTEPLKPKMLNKGGYVGNQLQVAYNAKLGKWILMTGAGVAGTFSTPQWPNGKYDNPELIKQNINQKGLRDVRFYDTSDPASFTHMESSVRYYANGIQVIDVSDPTQPKFIANWWLPGQRDGEEEEYKKWREYGDKKSFTTLHGPMYVPQKVEDGGRYGYSAYSAFGMMIHDLSDIKNPKLIGRFYPKMKPGAIPFHTIDIARLNRGFVITNPEALNPDCNEPYQPLWVVDVKDPTKPKSIRNPAQPHNVGYFIPPQPGSLDDYLSYPRDTDNVFVEWDRRLMWVATGTGIYLITSPALGKPMLEPMPVKQWSLPGLNVGHT